MELEPNILSKFTGSDVSGILGVRISENLKTLVGTEEKSTIYEYSE